MHLMRSFMRSSVSEMSFLNYSALFWLLIFSCCSSTRLVYFLIFTSLAIALYRWWYQLTRSSADANLNTKSRPCVVSMSPAKSLGFLMST